MIAEKDDLYLEERQKMVKEQIRDRGVSDERVLNALLKVKRHLFVPEDFRHLAYTDRPLAIGHEQTISQPYIVAYMTEALRLSKDDKVLEIGTGSGYQAAVLAEMVKDVYSIEIVPELAESARKRLNEMGYRNIQIKQGDGFLGWEEHARYDAVIVTAAPDEIPRRLVEQLVEGGRLVIPIGSGDQELYLFTKQKDGLKEERLLAVRFVPMIKGNSH